MANIDSQSEPSIPKWTPEGDPPLSMIIIGKTGEGKSATANTILGWNGFKKSASFWSETSNSQCKEGVAGGRNVLVVDTPGVFDTKEGVFTNKMDRDLLKYANESPTCKELIKSFSLATSKGKTFSGIDVFILVFRLGKRFTEEDFIAYNILKQIFGESLVKHTIVLFTHFDAVAKGKEGPSNNFADWLKRQQSLPERLQSLLEDCNWRVIAFNNNLDIQQSKQACDLIRLIGLMTIENDNKPYNSEFLENAKKLLDDEIEKRAKAFESKVRKELEEKIKTLELENKEATLELENIQNEIKANRKQITLQVREELSEEKGYFDKMVSILHVFRDYVIPIASGIVTIIIQMRR